MSWYSAMVRAVVLLEGQGTIDARSSLFVFRANEYEDALLRAVRIARARLETEYVNGDGLRVRWRVARVLTLDRIDAEDLDGAEVWTEGRDPAHEDAASFDTVFSPETSTPENSGV